MSYTVLAELATDETLRRAVFDSSGSASWCVLSSDRGYYVMAHGRRESAYDSVDDLAVDMRTGRFGYIAYDNGAWLVVVDGIEQGPFEWAGGVALLTDGRAVYTVIDKGRYWVHVGNDAHGPFDEASLVSVAARRDAWAFAAQTDAVWRVFDERGSGRPFDEVTGPITVCQNLEGYCGLYAGYWHVVVGRELKYRDLLGVCGSPQLRADGLWGAWGLDSAGWRILSAIPVKHVAFDAPLAPDVQIGPTGARIAGIATRSGAAFVLLNGRIWGPWSACSRVSHAKTAPVSAWIAATGPLERGVFLDGTMAFSTLSTASDGEQLHLFGEVAMNDDGSELAIVGRTGDREHVVINGRPQQDFLAVSAAPRWSGRCGWFYSAMTLGQEWVVVEDERYGPFDRVWLPEELNRSSRPGFGARLGREIRWYWLDTSAE
jgi:hypothetical protein